MLYCECTLYGLSDMLKETQDVPIKMRRSFRVCFIFFAHVSPFLEGHPVVSLAVDVMLDVVLSVSL